MIHEPSLQRGIQILTEDLAGASKLSNGEILKRLLKKPFMPTYCGMETPRNSKFFEILELKYLQLTTGGIINYHIDYHKKFLDPNYYKKPKSFKKEYLHSTYSKMFPEGPKVLTMTHLEAGFVIWLGSLFVSFTVFLIEWLMRAKDCFIFLLVFNSYNHQKLAEITKRKSLLEKGRKMFFYLQIGSTREPRTFEQDWRVTNLEVINLY